MAGASNDHCLVTNAVRIHRSNDDDLLHKPGSSPSFWRAFAFQCQNKNQSTTADVGPRARALVGKGFIYKGLIWLLV